ncbi:magnesium transporter [Acinetobacter stercoris]|uniref:Magnesium transporter MgtE n=1 Tax=Acinetobacter stercoris TaxID=2126983 RepID=A0A2U3MZZ8_9GAMM|nr:magnesium transporter [Acinetobacter stercoris]SPL70992.1 Magnesium transporter MgtE [Acinetobacter stercoris]
MAQNNFLLLLDDALKHQRIDQALKAIESFKAVDIADILNQLPLDSGRELLLHLPERAYVFSYLEPEKQVQLAKTISWSELAKIIGEMSSDKRADIFKQLDTEQQNALLPALAQAEREDIRQLSQHAEGTAGAIMSSEYATLTAELNTTQAIQMLRLEAPDTETIYIAYVLDSDRKLLGVISLKQLILAPENALVQDLMIKDVIFCRVDTDQDEVAKKIARYDFLALPIVDDSGKMVGIVTYDDAMDVASEEATEDFLKSSAVDASSKLSIKTAPILQLYKKRVFWLVILVFGSLLSSIGIAHFEDIISRNIVLVFFLPLLVGSGGNAGAQSATLMVRALATGDVEAKDWLYLLFRELLVALCLGGTMALAVSILGLYRGDEMVALVLALSMTGIVLLGCIIGMSLPFILNLLKLDPASASAPLVTSICDATGVLVYLYIASQLLSFSV